MAYLKFPKNERGLKDIGWLKSNFTFSFSGYRNPTKVGFGQLRVFNDDFVQPKSGFGIHPHENMEIISILLAGKMNHIDSLGYKEALQPGAVQIMSAGSGLFHEEHNVGEEGVNFLQIWIHPKVSNVRPRYQRRFFPREKRENEFVRVVSNREGSEHCWINSNSHLNLGYYTKAHELKYGMEEENKCAFLFVIEGRLQVNGQKVETRDAIGLWDESTLHLQVQPNTEFLLIETPINP